MKFTVATKETQTLKVNFVQKSMRFTTATKERPTLKVNFDYCVSA